LYQEFCIAVAEGSRNMSQWTDFRSDTEALAVTNLNTSAAGGQNPFPLNEPKA
jgi:hypothetical protein